LLLFVFGFPKMGVQYSFFLSSVIVLAVYTSAFVAEALRSGINAIPVGQAEAARAMGLTFSQTLRYVVLPQSFRTVIPPLGNTLIILIKNTSLAAAVSVGELTKLSSRLITEEARPIAVLIVVGICYLMLTLPTGYFVGAAEKRLAVLR
jgi:glutamate transport system permease protein